MSAPSYVSGCSDRPLLGETIGEALLRTAARLPDLEAAISELCVESAAEIKTA
jgi:hypothetical protein